MFFAGPPLVVQYDPTSPAVIWQPTTAGRRLNRPKFNTNRNLICLP